MMAMITTMEMTQVDRTTTTPGTITVLSRARASMTPTRQAGSIIIITIAIIGTTIITIVTWVIMIYPLVNIGTMIK